ncbi:MAG TPA: DUF4177 domain-containing protein [Thermomonas sp.]|nr:DUF4177 domain-containing protein [Thermomonas sp.]
MSTRWNYKVVEVTQWMGTKPKKIEETIAPLGQLGWELVAVTQVAATSILYFKKPA